LPRFGRWRRRRAVGRVCIWWRRWWRHAVRTWLGAGALRLRLLLLVGSTPAQQLNDELLVWLAGSAAQNLLEQLADVLPLHSTDPDAVHFNDDVVRTKPLLECLAVRLDGDDLHACQRRVPDLLDREPEAELVWVRPADGKHSLHQNVIVLLTVLRLLESGDHFPGLRDDLEPVRVAALVGVVLQR
jgi:hypothetical protein